MTRPATQQTAPYVALPKGYVKPTNIFEKIVEIVGKPKYEDILNDNGHYRCKWTVPFTIDEATKVRDILLEYPNWMIIHFNPEYKAKVGNKVAAPVGVIKFVVNPRLISYPYIQQKATA